MSRVVVIDDRITNRNILAKLSASVEEGLQVQSFASPVTALRRLEQDGAPDLIVTDFNMPEMDGATFIRRARAMPLLIDVPIVVVTAYEDRDYCYRALEAGATDFLLSPVDHLEFRARARNLLTMRRQQRALAARAADLERALHETPAAWAGAGEQATHLPFDPDDLPLAIRIVDRTGRIVYVNAQHGEIFQQARADVVGRTVEEVFGEHYALQQALVEAKIYETGRAQQHGRHETIERPDGPRTLITVRRPVFVGGMVDRIVAMSVDVTDEIAQRSRRRAPASRDQLTGLPGEALFRDRLEREIQRAKREKHVLALLHLDLDRFKMINEAYGREFGDALIAAVATKLRSLLEEADTLARLRSDEFVVIRPGLRRPDEAAKLCRNLSEAFADPFVIDGQEVHQGVSIGVTTSPGDGSEVDQLLRNADLAMHRAKASGRDGYRFFAHEMNVTARRAVTLERELRQAFASEQFTVHYQPQISLRTRRFIGMEALVRWNHPHRGLVRPGEFIEVIEHIGLIGPLTSWVLRTSCRQLQAWQANGLGDLKLSVNLSPVQFRERGVEFVIERLLDETGIAPSSLDIELTENAVVANSSNALASLRYLHQLGVTLSLDDFGTGYSSLAYVKRLPVCRLKIDQSFIHGLGTSPNDDEIVRAIISLGHNLGLSVIAEGVETVAQLEHLRALGCDEVQGDLISPPVSAELFERLVRAGPAGLPPPAS